MNKITLEADNEGIKQNFWRNKYPKILMRYLLEISLNWKYVENISQKLALFLEMLVTTPLSFRRFSGTSDLKFM